MGPHNFAYAHAQSLAKDNRDDEARSFGEIVVLFGFRFSSFVRRCRRSPVHHSIWHTFISSVYLAKCVSVWLFSLSVFTGFRNCVAVHSYTAKLANCVRCALACLCANSITLQIRTYVLRNNLYLLKFLSRGPPKQFAGCTWIMTLDYIYIFFLLLFRWCHANAHTLPCNAESTLFSYCFDFDAVLNGEGWMHDHR